VGARLPGGKGSKFDEGGTGFSEGRSEFAPSRWRGRDLEVRGRLGFARGGVNMCWGDVRGQRNFRLNAKLMGSTRTRTSYNMCPGMGPSRALPKNDFMSLAPLTLLRRGSVQVTG
jgi:hypothetical protein